MRSHVLKFMAYKKEYYQSRMKNFCIFLFLVLISVNLTGQDCSIFSKANNIVPDKLCSPVSVTWSINYTGVNDAGTVVQIEYDWDDGNVEIQNATQTGPGDFGTTLIHSYTSAGDKCNYRPRATLIVDGVHCTSSSQEQIVTVWDNDDHNGGHMHIAPPVFPICFGNSADVQFQDLTQFNCVPPQENDVPNLFTRWVQWIYGTDITMTGTPVTINSVNRVFPFAGPVITLPGPVTGSGVFSDIMNVANDKLVGQYFQVTLRNWNYCNPYDDPNIAGPPADVVNGDHPPVVTTAIILIVPYPDATITPVDTLCVEADPVVLTAHDPGGTWSGNGVVNNTFDPGAAGPGNHVVSYHLTNNSGCSDSDQITITVMPAPVAIINPVSTLFTVSPPVVLTASPSGGSWTGSGVNVNIFDPASAGTGEHIITYQTLPDQYGCHGIDTIHIRVVLPLPDATITPVDTLCVQGSPVNLHAHDQGGTWSGDGVVNDTFDPSIAGVGDHLITYDITNTTGGHDSDQIIVTVMPPPVIDFTGVGTLYINSLPVVLTASPPGGDFTGPGVNINMFYPDSAGIGEHIITYETLTDRYGCKSTDTIHINVTMPPLPVAYFVPDTAGCSPLLVQFRNLSSDADSYLWDFGDKVYSTEKNPSHNYFVPGNFIVKLTVNNIAGQSIHFSAVSVYQDPTAVFSVYPTEVINNAQIVVFNNYSFNGISNLWDFGDGSTSTDESPWHNYGSEGIYDITLTVTSKDGCVDSAKYTSPVVVSYKVGSIKFPNAFVWNRSGPTGGYWSEANLDDNTFRPFFVNVIEYKLQIFNRWGVLIYESYDLAKGWDGYFGNGNLALQGVYVWKVIGRYADGTYFDKVGDVTFLH
jgi:PKD repeat protein